MGRRGWSWALLVSLSAGCAHRSARTAEVQDQVLMRELMAHSGGLHDALVRGDLHEARARAGQMAEALPPLSDGEDVALRLALAEVSGAATLGEAATGMGEVAQRCLDCHARLDVSLGETLADGAGTLWLSALAPEGTALEGSLEGLGAHLPGAPERALAERLRSAPLSERGEAYGALVAACAGCHLAGEPPPRPRLEGVPLPELRASMGQHFEAALELGRHVMEGDLELARRSAGALARTPLSRELPETAWPYVSELQEAARLAEQATTLVEMALATAQVELACARCHTATGAGPAQAPSLPPAEPHMAFHLYGVYWMGYGLLAPDERAWMIGATVLAGSWQLPPGCCPPPQQQELEEAVHGLAQYALTTRDPQQRAEIRAALLVSCPACHAEAGGPGFSQTPAW
jgi:hypothetical protein